MQRPPNFYRVNWLGSVAAAAIICMISTTIAAETTGTGNASPALTQDTADAILKELREIRRVLEKIEKQGGRAQRPSRPTTASVTIKDKQTMGADDAPVTVVEFTDYQCPFCLRFTNTTFPHLKKKYIDTGKVRWVGMNLPLAFHKDARKAAQAAHCAGEQEKFWEMRQVLFANPRKLGQEHLPAHAESLSLEMDAFNKCLASERHLAQIDQEAKDANAVRLTGTPSFIVGKTGGDKITGQVVIGAQPLNVFDAAIGKLLGEKPAAKKPAEQKQPAG
ncbi:MAG: DsbA family protein [Gammaproteobacteria bacterium]|nr:DsbA family protein [Gammaproteobacteria bacterium]